MPIVWKTLKGPKSRSAGQSQKQLLVLFAAAMFILVCDGHLAATTISEYHQRIRQAVTALDTLSQSDEGETEPARASRTIETLSAIRSTVPHSEIVQWRGQSLNVDNRWLHQELERYEQASDKGRDTLLKRITERLRAVEERLAEAEREGDAALLTKSEANARLSEILSRPQYARKSGEDSALKRLVGQLVDWLRTLLPRPEPRQPTSSSLFSILVQLFVILLALAVIVYALRIVISHTLRKRRSSPKKPRRQPRIILGERLEPDQHSVDLLAEADALARSGDLRAAIRKTYIALLLELGERKFISLEPHKTNRDYLQALAADQSLYESVDQLTHSFETYWYGFSRATEDDWRAFRAGYRRVLPG